MKQRFTSKQTSINSIKAPAIYSMKRAVNVMTGKRLLTSAAVGSIQPQKPPGFTVRRSPFMTHSIERRNITPTVGKKTGAPLIIWTKSPPLSRVGMLPGLVV